MIGLVLRLSLGSGRAERGRFALTVGGAAVGTGFLLAAATVLRISYAACPDYCVAGDPPYTSHLLDEPGLRPGVALACMLLLIPVLVFLAQVARIAAAQRAQRLAGLRLAGATAQQVRLLAALDTGLAAVLGVAVGTAGLLGLQAVLEAVHRAGTQRALPSNVSPGLAAVLCVALAVPLAGGAASALALRKVVSSPLAVYRRHRTRPASALPTALLVVGLGLLAVVRLVADRNLVPGFAVALVLGSGALLTAAGLVLAPAWLSARLGRSIADRANSPALLLAGRRLERDPFGQARALSAILLGVLVAAVAETLRALTLREIANEPEQQQFFASSYDLVDVALAVGMTVAALGLLVAMVDAVSERRRTLAALVAAGTPQATLRRALLLQTLLPVVPAVLFTTLIGVAATVIPLTGPRGSTLSIGDPVLYLRLSAVILIAIGLAVAATAATLPLLRRTVAPAELRYE